MNYKKYNEKTLIFQLLKSYEYSTKQMKAGYILGMPGVPDKIKVRYIKKHQQKLVAIEKLLSLFGADIDDKSL